MKHGFLSALLFLMAGFSVAASQKTWLPVGNSDMHWAFFKLYNVTLLTDDGTYAPDAYPQALEIVYYRNIDKNDLVEATGDQWQRLGIPDEKTRPWLTTLGAIWPDIRQNDTLRVEVDADGRNRFLYNGHSIGSVDDAGFSSAFLSIWLSPDTSHPDIRKQLLAGRKGNV